MLLIKHISAAFYLEKIYKLEYNRKECRIFEPNRVVQSKKIITNVEYHIAFQYLTKTSSGKE